MSQKSSFSSIKKYDPYFSEKRTSSKIFHKYSQSQIEKDFQQNSKNDFDNPVDFNSKILENDKAVKHQMLYFLFQNLCYKLLISLII